MSKLANELARRGTGKTVYILDEPTTGLHIADVHRLIEVLQKLVDAGNTVIVIEHNLDLIKCADHIIDLGPEGGSAGGLIIAEGTPEQVAEVPGSFTGQYLKPLLEKDRQLREAEAEKSKKKRRKAARHCVKNHTFLTFSPKKMQKSVDKTRWDAYNISCRHDSVGKRSAISGCSAVLVARLNGVQEAVSSILATRTINPTISR